MATTPWSAIPRVRLAVFELLIGATAAGGGFALMTTGDAMSDDLQRRLPLHSWLLAGLILLVVVGGSQVAGGLALLGRRPYARDMSYAAGGILMAWIVGQIVVLRTFQPLPHLVMFGAGGLIVVLTHRLPSDSMA